LVDRVIELCRQHTPAYEIARRTAISPASVSRILRRVRLGRWRDLHSARPVQRYEHPHPGDLLHLDIKGMTRFSQVSLRGDGRLPVCARMPALKLSTSPSTITPASPSPACFPNSAWIT
jgi:hypothetical protein